MFHCRILKNRARYYDMHTYRRAYLTLHQISYSKLHSDFASLRAFARETLRFAPTPSGHATEFTLFAHF